MEERIRQLGDPVEEPYTTVTLYGDPELELSLLRQEAAAPEDLAKRVLLWRVSLYESDGRVGQWRYLAEVATDGELVSLLRGTPGDFRSAAAIPEFLVDLGGRGGARSPRTVVVPGRELLLRREPDRHARIRAGRHVHVGRAR